MADKKCPLYTIAMAIYNEGGPAMCLEDDCAWYDTKRECCAIHKESGE